VLLTVCCFASMLGLKQCLIAVDVYTATNPWWRWTMFQSFAVAYFISLTNVNWI